MKVTKFVLLILALWLVSIAPTTTLAKSHSTVSTTAGAQLALWEICNEISAAGYCGVQFGMTQEEANDAAPSGLHGQENIGPDESGCYYLGIAENSFDVAIMFVQGHVHRIDVSVSNIQTPEGAQVGMKLKEVKALYPDSTLKPNFYVGSRYDLFVDLGDELLAVFETDDSDVVTSFRIGTDGPARYVEGCA
jgi:hypothetical protein